MFRRIAGAAAQVSGAAVATGGSVRGTSLATDLMDGEDAVSRTTTRLRRSKRSPSKRPRVSSSRTSWTTASMTRKN